MKRLLALILAVAVVGAACGDDDSSSEPEQPAQEQATTTAAPEPEPEPAEEPAAPEPEPEPAEELAAPEPEPEPAEEPAEPSQEAEEVLVGMIMEARPAAQPWSAAIHDSGELFKSQNPNVRIVQTFDAFDPTSAEPNARQLIADGAAVIVFHSFALNDIAHLLASESPTIAMSVSSFAEPVPPNLTIATASYLQIGYANCWLLSTLSESGKIGFVGAAPIPYATELQLGCELGAAAANPDVEVLSAYSDDFVDQQATLEQAQNLLDQGIDGLFPASATEDSLGGFQLCEQAGLNCAGWAADAARFAPTTAVSSAVVDWTVMLQRMLDEALAGSLTAETFDATFANGGLTIAELTPAAAERVSEAVAVEFAGVVSALEAGEIDLPASTAHPCCP